MLLCATAMFVLPFSCLRFDGPSFSRSAVWSHPRARDHHGRLAVGETASLVAPDTNPEDHETRFGLGVVHYLRAVETLGKAMYEYGTVSDNATQPFLRLPVLVNEKPSGISY